MEFNDLMVMELHVGVSCHRLVTKALVRMTLRRGLLISTYYSPKCTINHSLSKSFATLHTYLSMPLSPVSSKLAHIVAPKLFRLLSTMQLSFYPYEQSLINEMMITGSFTRLTSVYSTSFPFLA